jgi:hypothetical protein
MKRGNSLEGNSVLPISLFWRGCHSDFKMPSSPRAKENAARLDAAGADLLIAVKLLNNGSLDEDKAVIQRVPEY